MEEIRNTVYYKDSNQRRKKQQPLVIEYNDGIKVQHVMASASLPENLQRTM
jgi:hypothetical protein